MKKGLLIVEDEAVRKAGGSLEERIGNYNNGSLVMFKKKSLLQRVLPLLASGVFAFSSLVGCRGGSPQNNPPVIESITGDSVKDEGQSFYAKINASDPDGDSISYSAAGLPAGLTINSNTGEITGTPSYTSGNPAGGSKIYGVSVTVTDSKNASASQSWQLTINDVNRNPVITSTPGTNPLPHAQLNTTELVYDVNASDDLDESLTYEILSNPYSWLSINSSTGEITANNPPEALLGNYANVTIEVSDGKGGTALQDLDVLVCSQYQDKTNKTEGLIIVNDSSLAGTWQRLADYETRKGIKTEVVTADNIYSSYPGRDNPEKIRNYLIAKKSSKPELEYVLLNSTPTRGVFAETWNFYPNNLQRLNMICDAYFSCLEGNWDADNDGIFGEWEDNVDRTNELNVGRLEFTNTTDVDNYINNVIAYDADLSKANNLVFSAAYHNPPNEDGAEEKDFIYTSIPLTNKIVTRLYESGYNGGQPLNKAALINALNSGCNIWNHEAHGNELETYCGEINWFDRNDAQSLTGNPFFVYFVSSCTGNISIPDDTITEALLKNKAIGVISPSDVGIYPGISANFDIFFFKKLYLEGINYFGKAFSEVKDYVAPVCFPSGNGKNYDWVYKSLNLFGWPGICINTDNLGNLSIEQASRTDAYELTTKLNGIAEPNTKVTIVTPLGVYAGVSGTDGRFVLPYTPNSGNKITATKPNCRIAKIN
ncbi:MAG: C25 family cysteine peptidase [Candidatus Aenigmatarchaeota archaeon]